MLNNSHKFHLMLNTRASHHIIGTAWGESASAGCIWVYCYPFGCMTETIFSAGTYRKELNPRKWKFAQNLTTLRHGRNPSSPQITWVDNLKTKRK